MPFLQTAVIVCSISASQPFECQFDLDSTFVFRSGMPVLQVQSLDASAIVLVPVTLSMFSSYGF